MPKILTVKQWAETSEEDRGNAACASGWSTATAVPAEQDEIKALLHEADADEIEAMEKAGIDPDKAENVLPYVFSTEQRDRDGDRIMVRGWDLADYKKNPVILPSHQSMQPSVGRSLRTWKDLGAKGGPKLRGIVQFTTREQNPLGAMLYELAKAGFQKAGSVGFLPIKYERDPEMTEEERKRYPWGGLLFHKQGLLEFSPTAVPSNPGALQGAKAAGIDVSPFLKSFAAPILDGEVAVPFGYDRDAIEKAALVVEPPKPTVIGNGDPEPVKAPSTNPEPEPEPDADPVPEAAVKSARERAADLVAEAADIAARIDRFDLAAADVVGDLAKSSDSIRARLKSVVDVLSTALDEEPEGDTQTAAQKNAEEPSEPERDPYEGAEQHRPADEGGFSLASLAAALSGANGGA